MPCDRSRGARRASRHELSRWLRLWLLEAAKRDLRDGLAAVLAFFFVLDAFLQGIRAKSFGSLIGPVEESI